MQHGETKAGTDTQKVHWKKLLKVMRMAKKITTGIQEVLTRGTEAGRCYGKEPQE